MPKRSGSAYHVVFSGSPGTNKIARRSIPDNFEINCGAYNVEILPHAAAVVCNSGMGIVLEALRFGVPILATPNHAFNSEVAYRLAELGLGIHLRNADLSPQNLQSGVHDLISSSSIRDQIRWMQASILVGGGARRAADLLESVLCTQ